MQKTLLSTLILSMFTTPLWSQEEPVKLDKVIVTANKIEQNIREVPTSISLITDVDMQDKGMHNITDVVKQIPSLSEVNFGFQRTINFRGINPSQFSSTNPVVIYADGIPQSSIFGYDLMLEDAQRVEVLRGPQSTLYGKESIGGVINVISKQPQNHWQGRAGLEYGSNNHMQGTFNTNGALIKDKVFLNIGVLADKNDGWITNDYDGSDGNTFKEGKINTSLTVKPSKKMTAKLSLSANNTKTTYYNAGFGEFGKITRKDAKNANYDVPSPTKNQTFSQALNLSYDFELFKITSLTTHSNIKVDSVFDGDLTYDPSNSKRTNGLSQFQNTDVDTISWELKLSADKSTAFKWVTGLYFEKEDSKFNSLGYQFPYVDRSSGTYMGSFATDIPSQAKAETAALFAQGSYSITDALSLTLGGRYQQIDKNIDLTTYIYPVAASKAAAIRKTPQQDSQTWNAFLPKVALKYSINNSISLFGSYAKGYLPGGFNYFPQPAGDNLQFEPQYANNFEIGVRGSFLDNSLDLGTTIFYLDIDDIHLHDFGQTNTGTYFSHVTNGGKAKSTGIELDGSYQISGNWRANAALGWINAKYSKHTNAAFNGNKIRATPEYTANFGVGYVRPQSFYGRVDINAQGSIYFDDANTQKQDAWATADVKAGYLIGDFNLYAYVKNITDEAHVENVLNKLVYFNKPRTFGAGIKYSF